MSATARASGGTHRTGGLRTGTHRTGVVRGGAGRTTTAGNRSVGHRALPTDTAAVPRTSGRSGTARSQPSRSVPVRAELRLVPTPARGRSRRLPFVLLVLALLVGTTLSLLVLNTAIAVDSLKATSLRQQNDHREQELQRLQQEVVDGSTVQKLAGDAAKAGLVPAGTAGYLVVEPDGTSTFRGTPSPATAPSSPPPSPGQTQAPTPPQDQAQTGAQPTDSTGGG
jgi:hypothetical protein